MLEGLSAMAARELSVRAARDRPRLAAALGRDRIRGRITAVRALGDPHRHGRRVARVRLDDRLTAIYKPRSLAPDLFWAGLVDWLGRRIGAGPLRTPWVVSGRGYGWTEALPPRPPRSPDGARRLQVRMGALLALADVFELRDLHRDNLLAVGEHPVVIDAETIAHPRLPPFDDVPSLALTGFLPVPGATDARAGCRVGCGARPDPDREALVEGYRDGYRILRREGAALLRSRAVLGRLATLRVRVVVRSTEVYRAALRRTGEGWPPPTPAALPLPARSVGRVIEAERRALARGDVPVFSARAGGRDLRDERGIVVSGCFARSAMDRIADRVARLGPSDERAMVDLIRGSLALAELGRGLGTRARGRSGRRSRSR